MRIQVDDVRLYFDVEGLGFVPDGPRMKERPTLILLHGGPGFDHTSFKPLFSQFAEYAQVIYYEHRGCGRSDKSNPGKWNLNTWVDDFHGFCQTLQIEKPLVFGQSFGGMVAMGFASKYPEHPAKVVLSSTSAKLRLDRILDTFRKLGNQQAIKAAETFFNNPNEETMQLYKEVALPSYNPTKQDPNKMKRTLLNLDVCFHFFQHEFKTMDFREDLRKIKCPTLVLAGEKDPITPIDDAKEMVAHIQPHLVQKHFSEHAGHGIFRDEPEESMAVIKQFLFG